MVSQRRNLLVFSQQDFTVTEIFLSRLHRSSEEVIGFGVFCFPKDIFSCRFGPWPCHSEGHIPFSSVVIESVMEVEPKPALSVM